MSKQIYLTLSFGLLVCILQSCSGVYYPGLRSNPIGPRMIQPIPRNGDINALPQDANFVQSYPKYKKTKTNSKFGALVRIIEFEYDIEDTFSIIPRITTGYDEGEMTGVLTILLDQYELTYENKSPQVREYVETVSYETSSPSSISTIQNTKQEKQDKLVKRSQLYNSAKFSLEDEDVNLILRSKKISYIIHFQNTEVIIFPTKEQFRIVKRMIQKYYNK